MSYLALYRKYRPDNFNDVVGQENIVKVLKNSIIQDKLSHAYLFYGPRGTGKTTIAKTIAKIINCESKNEFMPCEKCNSCIAFNEKNNPDIIEIDAASNNGVDEIREIREKVNLMPTMSKFKVYIIDEVHMLSSGAFNALLKTLEEPPKHVIFILATTEMYKVPETIVSRCQTFEFKRISEDHIFKRLQSIAIKENIEIEDSVLELISKYSDGGLRDAINMLDKLSCSINKITVKDFYDFKGLVEETQIKQIYDELINNNYEQSFKIIEQLSKGGKNISLLAEKILIYIKTLIISESKISNKSDEFKHLCKSLEIMSKTIESMKTTIYKKDFLEIGLIQIGNLNVKSEPTIEKLTFKENIKEEQADEYKISKSEEIIIEDPQEKEEINSVKNIYNDNKKIRINNALTLADKTLLSDLKIKWVNFSDYLQELEYASIVSYLIDGNLRVAGKKDVIISVKYDSMVENADINRKEIEKLFEKVMGSKYNIAFILDNDWKQIKEKYINDKKGGKNYSYQEESKEINKMLNKNVKPSEVVDAAISLFGEDKVKTN